MLEFRRKGDAPGSTPSPNLSPRRRQAMLLQPSRATFLRWVSAVLGLAAAALGRAEQTDASSLLPNESLAGHTLSAVLYLPAPPKSRHGELARQMLQAYLSPDGRALVRLWNTEADRYSVPAATHWSLSGSRLCIGLPAGEMCVDVHVWGPRIDGVATGPYRMLVGDLRPGNAIIPGR